MDVLKKASNYSKVAIESIVALSTALTQVKNHDARSRIEDSIATLAEVLTDTVITGIDFLHGASNEQAAPGLEQLLDNLVKDGAQVIRIEETPSEHSGLNIMSVDMLDEAAQRARDNGFPVDDDEDEE